MSSETENLGLFKYDPVADKDQTFNIDLALNQNWDTVDKEMAQREVLLKSSASKEAIADTDAVAVVDSTDSSKTKRVLWSTIKSALSKIYVPLTRKINSKSLSSDVTLTGADIQVSGTDNTKIDAALSNKVPIVNHGDTNVSLLDHSLSDGLHVCSNWADCPPGLTDSQGTCLVITYLHYEDLGQYWGRRIYFPTNNKTVYINNCEVSKWNGWEPIATDVPPQEFELSLINGWNAATFRYSKMQNGLVIINATDITKGSGETGVGMFVIGTIPEGFRPPEAIFSVVNNYTKRHF